MEKSMKTIQNDPFQGFPKGLPSFYPWSIPAFFSLRWCLEAVLYIKIVLSAWNTSEIEIRDSGSLPIRGKKITQLGEASKSIRVWLWLVFCCYQLTLVGFWRSQKMDKNLKAFRRATNPGPLICLKRWSPEIQRPPALIRMRMISVPSWK